jgi:hypothetical protein
MHFTIGIRLPLEDQVAGMDIHGHGQGWTARTLPSTNQVIPENGTVLPERPPTQRSFKRHSVRDILQEAFT